MEIICKRKLVGTYNTNERNITYNSCIKKDIHITWLGKENQNSRKEERREAELFNMYMYLLLSLSNTLFVVEDISSRTFYSFKTGHQHHFFE